MRRIELQQVNERLMPDLRRSAGGPRQECAVIPALYFNILKTDPAVDDRVLAFVEGFFRAEK